MSTPQDEAIFATWTSDLEQDDISVVCMCGELDASSAPEFMTDIHCLVHRRRNLIMDVHLLEYVDSTGVAAIFSTKNALEHAGNRLCLVGCHGLLTKILHSMRVESEISCFEDVNEAVAGLGAWRPQL